MSLIKAAIVDQVDQKNYKAHVFLSTSRQNK